MASYSLMVGRDHAVPVEPNGGTAVVTVDLTGGTVYYADNPQLSAASNQGSIAPGGSHSFSSQAWLIASSTAGVLVSVTSVYDLWEAVTLPISSTAAPTGQEFINVLATPFSNVRFNTIAQSSLDYFGGELQSDGTQNDEVVFQKYLQAGTYTMDLFYKTGSTHGIFTIFVDGVQLGTTVDSWVTSGGAMLRATIAGITVTGDTVHAIRLLMATKNASATSFVGIVGGISMTRTGS